MWWYYQGEISYAISKGTARNNFQNKLKSVLRLLEMLSESTRVFSPSLSTVKDFFLHSLYCTRVSYRGRWDGERWSVWLSRLLFYTSYWLRGQGVKVLKFSRTNFTYLLNLNRYVFQNGDIGVLLFLNLPVLISPKNCQLLSSFVKIATWGLFFI